MEKTSKKKFYMMAVPPIIIGIIVIIWILSMLLRPKIDYTAMAIELKQYAYSYDNVKKIDASDNNTYQIVVLNEPWYAASERDKLVFCKKMNEGITAIGWKYKAIKDNQIAYVYYYDEDGINIAEPGKWLTTESKILH